MLGTVDEPTNVQAPSTLKKVTKVLLTPVRWLIIISVVVLTTALIFHLFMFLLALSILSKLYSLASGRMQEWVENIFYAIREVVLDRQNTHDTDVNNAININVQKLKENYGEPDIDDKFIEEVKGFINELELIENNTLKDADKYQLTEDDKKYALACLERIKKDSDKQSVSGLTLKQILNLVWKACNDKIKESADSGINIDEVKEINDKRIAQKKYQLVRQLIDAQTEYGTINERGDNACFTGTFNNIVSSLYSFDEFSFLERADEETIRLELENDLKTKGEELFNQLNDDQEKKKVAEALASEPATNFFTTYIESFREHHARAGLGNVKFNELVRNYLQNLQHIPSISVLTP